MAHHVTEHGCAKLRELAWRGRPRRMIADEVGASPSAARYHIRGDCVHDHDVPPVRPADPEERHDGRTVPTLDEFG